MKSKLISFDPKDFTDLDSAQKQTPHVLAFNRRDINHDRVTLWLVDHDIPVVFDTKALYRMYRFKTDEDLVFCKLAFGGETLSQLRERRTNDPLR